MMPELMVGRPETLFGYSEGAGYSHPQSAGCLALVHISTVSEDGAD